MIKTPNRKKKLKSCSNSTIKQMALQHVIHIVNKLNLDRWHFSILNLEYRHRQENVFHNIQSLKILSRNTNWLHSPLIISQPLEMLIFLKVLINKLSIHSVVQSNIYKFLFYRRERQSGSGLLAKENTSLILRKSFISH